MAAADYLNKPYSRVLVPEANGTFRAEILEFPGCIAVGDTAPQALANLEDVATSWLESMLARGQSIPEALENNEYSGKFVLRLSKSVHQKAALAARQDGVSLNYFIANCVAEHVGLRSAQPTWLSPAPMTQNINVVLVGHETTVSSSPSGTGAARAQSTNNPWGINDARN